jgi:gamma-glutamyltranspeptidase/glutathione hydrolase
VVVDGAGFLLNNEMDDFSVKPGIANQFGLIGSKTNSIEPGKRMLSSMTPTIILKDGFPFLIVGSPGGSTILTVVLQVILNCIDFKMDIQEAINQPRFHHQWLPDQIDFEEFGMTEDVKENLIKRGHKIGQLKSLGRVEGILIDKENNIIFGATDPRGFGSAEGY